MIETNYHAVSALAAQANINPQPMTEEQLKEAQAKHDAMQAERELLAAERFLTVFKELKQEMSEGLAVNVAGVIVLGYNWQRSYNLER